MRHLSDDEIILLAETADEEPFFPAEQIEMLDHLETCKQCYEKFCAGLALLRVTGKYSYPFLSEIYGKKRIKSPAEQAKKKTLAVVNLLRNFISDTAAAVMEQVRQKEDAFMFMPAVAMATRSAAGSENRVYILENVYDKKTYIAMDAESLMVQINSEDLGEGKIKAFIELETGERIPILLETDGKIIKGRINNLPKENARLVIQEEE